MNTVPHVLYYNCDDPLAVIHARSIKPSKAFTGVSFSEWSELGSHGPFKITFKNAPWFKQFIPVLYWQQPVTPLKRLNVDRVMPDYYAENQFGEKVDRDEYIRRHEAYRNRLKSLVNNDIAIGRIWKENFSFKDEREWYSPLPVSFSPDDIVEVTFMANAPCILGSRKLKQFKTTLQLQLGGLYQERIVNDSYLMKR